jgi:hypothetical protein
MNAPKPPAEVERLTKIRAAYSKAKACSVLGVVFAVTGFFLFASLFQQRVAPDPISALSDPSTLLLVVFPFVPAIVLSFVARRYEKRYLALLEKQ